MLGYITLGTNDLDASSRFYDSLFAEINVERIMHGSEEHGYVVWAKDQESTGFSILKPFNGEPAQPGNGNMAALSADSPEKVKALYNKALELGGTCEGQPGDRGNGFYAAYFRDLDGNKLNAYCMIESK
ncbi:VOC family protein [Marinicella litoralis]|uniref:Putative lactoylglutathione lyase n=1 Tax=Marinicella litoralis TaxID=644220 RepID=A0A4R6XUL3_9GAMM|nr:VOC family protein [Marinicella litoralis]TDR23695.1 putative lactoylglutathione lyase [Marinicella litoralis]